SPQTATRLSLAGPPITMVTQQANKFGGAGASGAAQQGRSVSLSSDGNTALVGGPGDNSGQGAAGSTRAAAVSGPSKETSSSAPARVEPPNKVSPYRSP
ncbi:MAG: hypothetical protein WBM51_15370, partial [Pseudolabrys sp.]